MGIDVEREMNKTVNGYVVGCQDLLPRKALVGKTNEIQFLLSLYSSAKMPEKKRKRNEESHDGRPNKKAAIESPAQTIKVSVIEDGEQWAPVLGTWNSLSYTGC